MKEFNKDKFKFYCKYLIPYGKFDEFEQRIKSINLAITLNPKLAEEAKRQLIQDYPFTKEFLE